MTVVKTYLFHRAPASSWKQSVVSGLRLPLHRNPSLRLPTWCVAHALAGLRHDEHFANLRPHGRWPTGVMRDLVPSHSSEGLGWWAQDHALQQRFVALRICEETL